MVHQRVHIAPVRYDRARVLKAIQQRRAEVVYLLLDEEIVAQVGDGELDLESAPSYVERMTANLEEDVDLHLETIPHDDVTALLARVTTLLDKHEDDSVTVNISTGRRPATVGAALACMDDSTDGEAIHVTAAEYSFDEREEPLVTEGGEAELIPDYHVVSPRRQEVAVMAIVAARNKEHKLVKKKDLINESLSLSHALDSPLPFFEDMYSDICGDPELDEGSVRLRRLNKGSENRKNRAYKRIDRALDPLKDRNHLEETRRGRRKEYELTDEGRDTLVAFGHKIPEVIDHLREQECTEWFEDNLVEVA